MVVGFRSWPPGFVKRADLVELPLGLGPAAYFGEQLKWSLAVNFSSRLSIAQVPSKGMICGLTARFRGSVDATLCTSIAIL
jgi:hypothetical protein